VGKVGAGSTASSPGPTATQAVVVKSSPLPLPKVIRSTGMPLWADSRAARALQV